MTTFAIIPLLLFWCFCPARVVLAKINTLVEVHDNVLSKEAASWLHTSVKDWPNTDVVFVFPLKEPELHTPMEQVLNQIMHQLYPSKSEEPQHYVEFWKRTPWVHISAHADMDEGYGKQMQHQSNKHPETGHVLYLEMGSEVHGPTLVWNVTKGGELYQQPTSEMVVVPAVQGRLLRFQGHALHAVPRPADLYWSHQEDKREGPEFQRSVLLFNTWPVEGGKLVDYEIQNATNTEPQPNPQEYSCHTKSEWRPVEVVHYEPDSSLWAWLSSFVSSPNRMFQVPLMGNALRRGTDKYVAKLVAPIETPQLLEETSQVTSVTCHVPKHLLMSTEF